MLMFPSSRLGQHANALFVAPCPAGYMSRRLMKALEDLYGETARVLRSDQIRDQVMPDQILYQIRHDLVIRSQTGIYLSSFASSQRSPVPSPAVD